MGIIVYPAVRRYDMNDEYLLRYSRQITLPEIDIEGQKKIANSKVIIIGLGALGSVAATYLCRLGVGKLILCDFDNVELSNLHRQILFEESDINKSKVKRTIRALKKIRSDCLLQGIEKKLDRESLKEYISQKDIVIDATDNFSSRHAINSICFNREAFLVSGAALGWSGQLSVFNFEGFNSPCYECCFGFEELEDLSCSEAGVVAPVTGIIGSMQAMEVMKRILNLGSYRKGVIENFNFLNGGIQKINIRRDPLCKTCGDK